MLTRVLEHPEGKKLCPPGRPHPVHSALHSLLTVLYTLYTNQAGSWHTFPCVLPAPLGNTILRDPLAPYWSEFRIG